MASPAKKKQWRDWSGLPVEVMAAIFSRLSAEDTLTKKQLVCKAWREASEDPLAWKRIDMYRKDDDEDGDEEAKFYFNLAVDRSSGGAVEISFENFGDDDDLEYIADSSKQIKLLRLISCTRISSQGLVTAVKKLPLLEEIEISLCNFNPKILKTLGRYCPLLKTFKMNNLLFKWLKMVSDRDAITIGEYMPGLKTLQLIGNYLTNEGLGAILEGCLGLECLDLRGCINVREEGEIWEQCCERVRNLRTPRDSGGEKLFLNGFEIDFAQIGSDDAPSEALTLNIGDGDDFDYDGSDCYIDTDEE